MSEEFLILRSLLHKSGLHYYTPACNRAAKDTVVVVVLARGIRSDK